MNSKKAIIISIFTTVFIAIGIATNVFADSITVGDKTFDISEQVTSVTCTDTSTGVSCSIVTSSGTTQTVQFGDDHDSTWYQNQVTSELSSAGLMSGGTDTDAEGGGTDETADPVEERCTSILPSSWCTEDGDGIAGILNLVLNIMTAGMGILATIGLVISGIQWLTARDKEDQVVKAKSRIFNIVIGIMVWGIMWLVLQWLLPGGINLEIGAII